MSLVGMIILTAFWTTWTLFVGPVPLEKEFALFPEATFLGTLHISRWWDIAALPFAFGILLSLSTLADKCFRRDSGSGTAVALAATILAALVIMSLFIGIACGLVFGLTTGLAWGLFWALSWRVGVGLIAGVVTALRTGLPRLWKAVSSSHTLQKIAFWLIARDKIPSN